MCEKVDEAARIDCQRLDGELFVLRGACISMNSIAICWRFKRVRLLVVD